MTHKSDETEFANRDTEGTGAAKKPQLKPTISADPVLGIPVLSFGEDAPVLTSEHVKEMLADFP